MDQRLNGLVAIIGRDPDKSKLRIFADYSNAQIAKEDQKFANKKGLLFLGADHSVPPTVTRCLPEKSAGHCKIEFLPGEKMKVQNLKTENVTFVNGAAVVSKVTPIASVIELGGNRYKLDMDALVAELTKILPAKQETYNIDHLEEVYLTYKNGLKEISKRQKRLGIIASAPIIFSLGSGLLTTVWEPAKWLMFGGFGLAAIGIYMRITDKSQEKRENLQDDFGNDYICPHCKKYLGNMSFDMLRKNYEKCPRCGALFESSKPVN